MCVRAGGRAAPSCASRGKCLRLRIEPAEPRARDSEEDCCLFLWRKVENPRDKRGWRPPYTAQYLIRARWSLCDCSLSEASDAAP